MQSNSDHFYLREDPLSDTCDEIDGHAGADAK